jgi:hypothetical protein
LTFLEIILSDKKMATTYIGSFIINSGRMSLAAGVSMRGWKPGLSPFRMSPIVDDLKCELGAWHVIRNRKDSWINDIFVLIHTDEFEAVMGKQTSFIPFRVIEKFKTWGNLRVSDTMYTNAGRWELKHKFDIHPGDWKLIACSNHLVPLDRMKFIPNFFLISPATNEIGPVQIGPVIN